MPKTYYIETFGCQMNKNDSQVMALSMDAEGFLPAPTAQEADIILYNTCSVRENAEKRALGRMKSMIGRKQKLIIATGCMAQRLGRNLIDDGVAHMTIGPYQEPAVGKLAAVYISSMEKNEIGPALFISQEAEDFHDRLHPGIATLKDDTPWHRWVTITHGCENFCSYCIVPTVRGPLISFPSREILTFVKNIIDNGAREITLLGQNVNQYGQDKGDLPFYRLLDQCASVPGVERLNFLTSHPKDFTMDIVRVMKDHSNMTRSIHLPLQSGSDPILQKMNRHYSSGDYRKTVDHIRSIIDDIALTTDIIVGFPGETEENFEQTLAMVEDIAFDDAFMYIYSAREGTPAADLEEKLTKKQKTDRLNRLIDVQRAHARERLKNRIGSMDRCIVEKISKKSPGEVMGRTFHNHPVVLPGSSTDISTTIPIIITDINGSTLQARQQKI